MACYLVRKYFTEWQNYVDCTKTLRQRENLNDFVSALQHEQKSKKRNPKTIINNKDDGSSCGSSYRNRFEAQKTAIQHLNTQLTEKDRVIEELKLGIIRDDLIKSIDSNKHDIRQIFSDCSAKVKCKVLAMPTMLDYVEDFMLSTRRAPKTVQRMEQRAKARAEKREIILERKRLIEEQRKRLVEQAIENKRVQDDEEKRRNLEAIKVRRERELELERIRQINKRNYLDKLDKAIRFRNYKLLLVSFKGIQRNCMENQTNYLISVAIFERKILQRSLNRWCAFVDGKYEAKNRIADALFAHRTLRKCFKLWITFKIEAIRNMQTAEDLYDFRLLSNTFVFWHRTVCIEIVKRDKLSKVAEHHYNRRLVFQYFHLWRSLPAVMQLEKAKEEKKRKWREKVWKILPDYQPVAID